MSFRDANAKNAIEIQEGSFTPEKETAHTHIGSNGNLCLEEIVGKWEKFAVA